MFLYHLTIFVASNVRSNMAGIIFFLVKFRMSVLVA